jgi:endonuclease/exonuclease/phosphatase family metal-dependent hydrolase
MAGAPTKGVACFAVAADGTRTKIDNAELDVSFAPTFASEWYEMRVKRSAAIGSMAANDAGGTARGVVVMTDAAGEIEAWADPFGIILPPARRAGEPVAAGDVGAGVIPARANGTLRVMTLNVLKSGPVTRPDSFARLLNAATPDVVLLEEWDEGDATSVQAWFTTLVKSESGWHVLKPAGSSVAIASRYPITALGDPAEGVKKDDGSDWKVRYVAGKVNSPIGPVAVAAMHLKCCGSADSWEDQLRVREAKAINATFAAAAKDVKVRVMGGDLNLVGSRPPLDALRAGIDTDGTDMNVADPVVSGDHAMYTWVDWSTTFTPGRLDYLVYSDASAEVARCFVLDTSRLSDAALNAAGLSRSDSLATDHRPVVVDVRGKR